MSDLDIQDDNELYEALGHAIASWGQVEAWLLILFREKVDDFDLASATWQMVINFDARLKVIQKYLTGIAKDDESRKDITLLLNHTRKLAGKRNKIFHGLVRNIDGDLVIEPFFGANSKERLDLMYVRAAVAEFLHLSFALDWLRLHRLKEALILEGLTQSIDPRVPDLVLELRAQDEQSRTEQRERQKLLSHATRLAREGKLPDWN